VTLRVPLEGVAPGERVLAKEAAAYVARVHRLGAGDAFVAFDPEAAIEACAHVLSVGAGGRSVTVRIGDARPAEVRPRRSVTLVQALGKGDKMDAIVRDATELGATRIVPVIAERSVARPDREAERARRWRRIAVEAARQCGRGDAPRIDAPAPLIEALRLLDAPRAGGAAWGACLVPGVASLLADALRALRPAAPVTLVVGPEGGLSAAEIAACEAAGLARMSLGPLVLRTETVCAAVLGALLLLAAPEEGAL
jgi:16S rRNA (uracil1498-N3)-methyltransferase